MPEPAIKLGNNVLRYLKHYLYGLFANSFNGGATALKGAAGIGIASGIEAANVHALNPHQLGAAFVGALAIHAIDYFATHPLPTQLSTSETTPPFTPPGS